MQDSVYSGKQIGQLARAGINASWQGLPLHPFDDGDADADLTSSRRVSYEVSRAQSLVRAGDNEDTHAALLRAF